MIKGSIYVAYKVLNWINCIFRITAIRIYNEVVNRFMIFIFIFGMRISLKKSKVQFSYIPYIRNDAN